LDHLCEFIEDCEHTRLAVRILHLLAREDLKLVIPLSTFALFIIAVRAAAVSVLAKFGAQCEKLLDNILVLLKRSMLDTEDEVRDRATYYYAILSSGDSQLIHKYILNPPMFSLSSLERALIQYLQSDTSLPFDTRTVPSAPPPQEEKAPSIMEMAPKTEERPVPTLDKYAEQLAAVPEFSNLGPLFKSSTPIDLTEMETEYVVRCIKHTFINHIVLQFDCSNTLTDQLLEDVHVVVEGEGWDVISTIPCSSLPYGKPGTCYNLLAIPEDVLSSTGNFTATLAFKVRDCDPTTGEPETEEGYEDDYSLEDFDISVCDHMNKIARSNFAAAWEELGPGNELEDTFALSATNNLEEAVNQLTKFLGMYPCDRSDRVPEGTYRGGSSVLVRAKLALSDGVTMQLTVRSESPEVSEVVASAVG
ncbi:Coatomer subunit gamma-2, partial [Armadillidium vulgare]